MYWQIPYLETACGAVSTVDTSENSKHLVKNLNLKPILVAAMNTYFKDSLVAVKFNTT